jgi:hypothetical protein
MGRESDILSGRPRDSPGCAVSTYSSLSSSPAAPPTVVDQEGDVRSLGLDVHRDFCEVAVCEDGRVRSGGRVKTSPEALQLFADSLAPDDQVALEATGNALRIARLLEPRVARVVGASTKDLKAITEAPRGQERGARRSRRSSSSSALTGMSIG